MKDNFYIHSLLARLRFKILIFRQNDSMYRRDHGMTFLNLPSTAWRWSGDSFESLLAANLIDKENPSSHGDIQFFDIYNHLAARHVQILVIPII
jgi:hypothetical protein